MSERIVVEQTDGSIAVVIPAPGFTAQMCIDKGDVPRGAIQHEVVDKEDIPSDRTFRGAWVWDGRTRGKMRESVTKAKEISHERRRIKRTQEFKPLDVEATIPNMATEAEAKRQNVRSKYDRIQMDIDACNTTEELKDILAREDI